MINDRDIEDRLWDYIDGNSSETEKELIDLLLKTDSLWQKKHAELSAFSELLGGQELEMPALRFSRNVMDQIARLQVSPASRDYINKHVIRGLAAFFLTLVTGFFIYGIAQIHWSGAATDSIVPKWKLDSSRIDWGKGLSNNYVNIFLLINVVLGLFVLDRFLEQKKRNSQQQPADGGR